MRQFIAQEAVGHGAQHGSTNHKRKMQEAGAQANEHGSRAGTGHSPAQTKEDAPKKVALISGGFGRHYDALAPHVADDAFAYQPVDEYAEHYGCANDTIHVEGVEMKHFKDAKPRDDLCLHHDDAEGNAYNKEANQLTQCRFFVFIFDGFICYFHCVLSTLEVQHYPKRNGMIR